MSRVLILYINGETYSLKTIPNGKFEKSLFMAVLITLRVSARNLLKGNRRINTFCISFWCLAWASNSGFTSNKATHYLLDHGDFNTLTLIQNRSCFEFNMKIFDGENESSEYYLETCGTLLLSKKKQLGSYQMQDMELALFTINSILKNF